MMGKHRKEWNVLFVGDLHIPFEHKNALEFIKRVYEERRIDEIVFLGDIIDNHSSSYHDSDPDGLSAGAELDSAIESLKKWHDAFPLAKVCIGNHDSLPKRKAFTGGLSGRWIKNLGDVLQVPGWSFRPFHKVGKFFASHGLGQLVHTRAKDMGMSCIAGHVHSKFEMRFIDGVHSIFAGCLVDGESYAMAYGKWGKKSKLGCVVVYDINKNPIVEMIEMEE